MHATTGAIVCMLHCSLLVGSKELLFDVKDSDVNEVIFVGEQNVEMRCGLPGVTSLTSANVTIEHDESIIAISTDTNVTYTIDNVALCDGGNYICAAHFTFQNGTSVTEKAILVLNVQEITPYCFHNGTNVEEGPLLLTCYCLINVNCLWVQSCLSVHTSDISICPMTTCKHNNKSVSRVITQGLTRKRYSEDCSFGTSPKNGCYFKFPNDVENRFTVNPSPLPSLPSWNRNDQCDITTTVSPECNTDSDTVTTPFTTTLSTTTLFNSTQLTTEITTAMSQSPSPSPPPPPKVIIIVICVIVISSGGAAACGFILYVREKRRRQDKCELTVEVNETPKATVGRWFNSTQRLTSTSSTKELMTTDL